MSRIALLATLLAFVGFAQSGPMWVRIYLTNPEQVKELIQNGIDDIPKVDLKKLVVEALVPQDKKWVLSRFRYEVLDSDVSKTWRSLKEKGILTDFGPYYTYDEMQAQLDSIHQQYPDITTAKYSVGQSIFGRDIWVMKISDNPDVDEDEPTVFINGVHHAREPITCTIPIEFARYLCENYGVDPDITWLVDNREIYIMPVVNPDGYVYNESGDGYWRKNLRDNNNNGIVDDYDGVDLNRNYGYMWGYDDLGSSPDPSSQTYRGTGPFSEPEVATVRYFVDSIQPTIVINYHSYSNLIIYPWGYIDEPTPDEDVFIAMAEMMRASNGYTYGRPAQLLYPVNGEANDWMYGEQDEKPKIYSFCVEVGEAFWQPDSATIAEQVAENLPLLMFVTEASGLYLTYAGATIVDAEGELPDPGDTVYIVLRLKNYCPTDSAWDVSGTLTCSNPGVTVIDGNADFSNVGPFPNGVGSNLSDSFAVYIDPSVAPGTRIEFQVNVNANGGAYERPVTFSTVVGLQPGFFDDVESGEGSWQHDGGGDLWHITEHRSHSATHSWYCGNEGSWQYGNDMNAWLMTDDIALYPESKLVFWTYYDLESGYDYGYVEISLDGGTTWEIIGSLNGSSGSWVRMEYDLRSYSGIARFRFRLTSDSWVTKEGWYIDDVSVEAFLYPDIQINPVAFNVALPPDSVDTLWLVIGNTGEGDLTFSITDTEYTGRAKLQKPVALLKTEGTLKGLQIAESAAGTSSTKEHGGPDEFGYIWFDSDEQNAPEFQWIDITDVGTPLSLGDDDYESIELPFPFPFYGEIKTNVLISSNGYLTFGEDGSDYSNDPIPDTTDPDDFIAPFWEDLNPRDGGQILYYYDQDSNRIIVEWYEVPHFQGTGTYTFEAVLYPSGDIIFNYLDMEGVTDEATIGIENSTGTVGLEVAHNEDYVHNLLAVYISLPRGWLVEEPNSGTVGPQSEIDIALIVNTADLDTGIYHAVIRIESNDPDEQLIEVPFDLYVMAGFIVGDVNADGNVNQQDLVYLAEYLFNCGPPPQPLVSGDVNQNGTITASDLVRLSRIIYGCGVKHPNILQGGKNRK